MNHARHLLGFVLAMLTAAVAVSAAESTVIQYSGDGGNLQRVIDAAPPGVTIVVEVAEPIVVTETIRLDKPLTLRGLRAELPEGLSRTTMMIVTSNGVTLTDLELRGNYDSVKQTERAPMIHITKGEFTIERCVFHDSSKDGVMVTPVDGEGDIVNGVIRDITAYRMGRDAVSISGGDKGQRVRRVVVENVRLERGFLRGAVEVSDGSDDITVKNVYAEQAVYAIDVQDHGTTSAPNTNVRIEDVTAVDCKHIIRTANRDVGHADLTLRNFTATRCDQPVKLSNTTRIVVENMAITDPKRTDTPCIVLANCHDVRLQDVTIKGAPADVKPIIERNCTDVKRMGVSVE